MPEAPPNPTTQPSVARFIDSHVHLDADQFADDLDRVIGDAVRIGVTDFINIGYEPPRWDSTRRLSNRFEHVHSVFGMHPGSVDQWTSGTLVDLEHLIVEHRPLAIGEIGIDLFRGESNLDDQQAIFATQLDLALRHDLPVVIHMRASEAEVLDQLRQRSQLPPLLFHSFEGSSKLTEFVAETGALIGVGGLATRSTSASVREQIARLGLSRIVLETDAPYLIPTGRRGTRNVPANVPAIAEMLARLTQTELGTIADITTANTRRFFRMESGTEQ